MDQTKIIPIGDCAFCPNDAVISVRKLLSPTEKGPIIKVCQECFPKTLPKIPKK